MIQLWRAGITITLVALAIPAFAHPVPFSYLDLQVQSDKIEVSLTIHIYDVAHDLGVSPMERLLDRDFLKQCETAIHTILAPRMEFTADGDRLMPEWGESEILTDRQSIRFRI